MEIHEVISNYLIENEMKNKDSKIGHIEEVLRKQDHTCKKFNEYVKRNLFSTEFDKVVSIKTNSDLSKESQESPNNSTPKQSIVKHYPITEFDQI